MLSNKSLTQIHVILVTLSVLLATTVTQGAPKSAPAQVGILSLSGSPTSGSDVSYQFALSTTNAGTLLVKATYKGKKLKGKFPDLETTPPAGISTVIGPNVLIPTTYTGVVVFHVKVLFNGKTVATKSLVVSITTPPPVITAVATNLYDVGFENQVTLNGNIVPTSGMASPRTYSWTQTSGKSVVLSGNSAPAPTFTTDALTNFVYLGTGLYINDPDDAGYTNLLYVTPEHRFGTVAGLSMDAEQAGAATYGFQVLVSDGSITRTGAFTVACSSQTPAQPNIPVGVTALYKGATNSMNWTLLAKPTGSTASLNHTNGLIAELRPDIEGVYVVQDNVTGQILTNTAASWTGVQFCAICHGPGNNVNQRDIVTPWSQTAHASFFKNAIDGLESAHYNQSCIACHTVGYNKAPLAVNNGFDDVATQLGWQFPSVLQSNNFAAMPAALQALSNIQCENCHGPGSRHPGAPSISLDERICSSCHQDAPNHVYPQQWESSPHAGAYESLSDSHGNAATCARCHSPAGFISVARGVSAGITNAAGLTAVSTNAGPLTCQVCHDPHDTFGNPARNQLRMFDTVQLGNPLLTNSPTIDIGLGDSLTTANLQLTNSTVTVTNAGQSALCMYCHNAREWPTQVQVSGSNSNKPYYKTTAPSMSTTAEIFAGVGAADYGQEMGNSFHTRLASCQTCHMYALRAPLNGVPQDSVNIDGVVTPVTTSLYNSLANQIGSHTFSMSYQYTDSTGTTHQVDNIAACNQCHASFEPVTTFDFMPKNAQDYDGNGVIEGIQTETQGVLDNLGYLLKATGVTITTNTTGDVTAVSSSAGYSTNVTLQIAQRKAAWNWNLESHEGSYGVHNTQFTIRLLQTSYTDLSTNWTGNATNTYQNAFPSAYLR